MKTQSQSLRFAFAFFQQLLSIQESLLQAAIGHTKGLGHIFAQAKTSKKAEIFATIVLGQAELRSADDFRRAFKARRIYLGKDADFMLGDHKFKVSEHQTEVDLVDKTLGELGLEDGSSLEQILAKAKTVGLEFCPSEVGPALRLQHDHKSTHRLIVAMEPIADSDGVFQLFSLEEVADASFLYGNYGGVSGWDKKDHFVFVRSRD